MAATTDAGAGDAGRTAAHRGGAAVPGHGRAQPDRRRWRALAVLATVQFMLVLDDTVVNVALPSVQADLGFSATGLAWVVNAYVITAGGLLLLGGRMADMFGRRRMYLLGTAVFALASLTSGAAQTAEMLVASRFLQGVGAALVAPAALSMIALLFLDPKERAKALGIWGGLAALGGTTGVVLSGLLSDLANWRWIFFINLPVAVLALLLVPRLVGESRAPTRRRLDLSGSFLVTAGLVALIYGLLEAAESTWGAAGTVVPLLIAPASLVVFVVVESRRADPMVPLAFFRHRVRLTGYLVGLAVTSSFFAMFFSLTLYMQQVLEYSPLEAGLAYVPFGFALGAGIGLSSALIPRAGLRVVLPVGLGVAAAGLLMLAQLPVDGSYAADVLPGMLVLAFGNGMAFPALTVAAVSDVTEEDAGLAGGLQNTVLQAGGAVGLAALVSIGTRRSLDLLAEGASPALAAAEGFTYSFGVAAGVLALGALAAAVLLARVGPGSSAAPGRPPV